MELATSAPSRLKTITQALFVTFLWSTSWVLIKFGLAEIPAITFAGLRYGLAFLVLAPFGLRREQIAKLRRQPRSMWLKLVALGLIYYAATASTQFVSLQYLPAVTVSLMLSFTSVLVAGLGIAMLNERPTIAQWAGIGLYLLGVLIYFTPFSIPQGQVFGLIVSAVGVLANAVSSVLGRSVNREATLEPVTITVVGMGIGAVVMLVVGVGVQGLPPLSAQNWLVIVWLAVVNSALAFTLWNHTLRTLPAMESSIINNTMLFQIAFLAWLFLGEGMSARQIAGMIIAGAGTLLVQVRPRLAKIS